MAPDAKQPIDPLDALGNLYDRARAPTRPAPGRGAGTPPTAPSARRPTSMTVIGWLYIVGAGLTALSALMGMAASRIMVDMGEIPSAADLPPDTPALIALTVSLLPFFALLSLAQLGLAGFVLYAAIQFLRRRAWARTALEVMTWLGIVGTLMVLVAWGFMWVRLAAGIPAPSTTSSPASLATFGVVAAIVIGAIYVVPMALMVRSLRSPAVRSAVVR
jgi:hypothetical protein